MEAFTRSAVRLVLPAALAALAGACAVPTKSPVTGDVVALNAGYELHYPSGDRARRALVSGARSLCSPRRPDCYALTTARGDDTIVRVTGAGTGIARTRALSVGEAFDEAYRLRELSGAERAQPLLETTLPEPRSFGGDDHDPRAEAEPLWSVRHVRAPGAWELLRVHYGRSAGNEAAGIVIAHPDTGYRQHPEIWQANGATSPVWAAAGHDYLRDLDDPLDILARGNPGHGTVAASVMVSPAGCQIQATKCPTGTAPGARVVPVRMTASVVTLNQSRLSDVIRDAAGADRTRIKTTTDLMAIAAGGPPSWGLWKAVRNAERAGYLVLAAAGNRVRTVVWPARFPQVIAVAGSTVGCQLWSGSSRGRTVDVSAPGASVWNARTNSDDGSSFTDMSSGTTFAVSTAAGVAALWLAAHAAEPELEDLRATGGLTEAFRSLLATTSWRPGLTQRPPPAGVVCDPEAVWDESRSGAGIIDAVALLNAPLPRVATTRTTRTATVQDLPLWQTLYADDSPRARQDYARLFDRDPRAGLEDVAIFEAEVLHHYAADPRVAEALDALTESAAPGPEAYARARAALRENDLSSALRAALPS